MWYVDYNDVVNVHPLSPIILKHLIELTMKKRKYTRRNVTDATRLNKVDPVAGLVANTAQLGVENRVPTPDAPARRKLWPEIVFQKIETIFSDGTRSIEEKSSSVNLNP